MTNPLLSQPGEKLERLLQSFKAVDSPETPDYELREALGRELERSGIITKTQREILYCLGIDVWERDSETDQALFNAFEKRALNVRLSEGKRILIAFCERSSAEILISDTQSFLCGKIDKLITPAPEDLNALKFLSGCRKDYETLLADKSLSPYEANKLRDEYDRYLKFF